MTVFATACTSDAPGTGPTYDSVRDRLSDGPQRLYVGSDGSSGNVTARRKTASGWVEGVTALTITSGELSTQADASGKVSLTKFEVGVGPIELPEELFNKPAQLQDVKVKLASTVSGETVWAGDDDATASLTLMLDLEWAIAINGGRTPLGTQHLPPVPVLFTLTGAGDHIDATITLNATGELWDWAGLIELTGLELSLSASTVD